MTFENRHDRDRHLGVVRMKPRAGRKLLLNQPVWSVRRPRTQHLAQCVANAKTIERKLHPLQTFLVIGRQVCRPGISTILNIFDDMRPRFHFASWQRRPSADPRTGGARLACKGRLKAIAKDSRDPDHCSPQMRLGHGVHVPAGWQDAAGRPGAGEVANYGQNGRN